MRLQNDCHNLILGSSKLSSSFKKLRKIKQKIKKWKATKKYLQEQSKKGCRHMKELNWDFKKNWKPNCTLLYQRSKDNVDLKSN